MDKVAGLLHLCNKAGKLALGRVAVRQLSGRGELALVLIARDAGNDLRRKFSGIDTITSEWTSDKMGEIFGRTLLSVVGIKDRGFAAEISGLLETKHIETELK